MFFNKGGVKMCGMSQSPVKPEPRGEDEKRANRESWALEGKGGKKKEGMTKLPGRPSVGSNGGQCHQTGLPRFQSLLTFVNHQPVSLHQLALPAVTPSTQTG